MRPTQKYLGHYVSLLMWQTEHPTYGKKKTQRKLQEAATHMQKPENGDWLQHMLTKIQRYLVLLYSSFSTYLLEVHQIKI